MILSIKTASKEASQAFSIEKGIHAYLPYDYRADFIKKYFTDNADKYKDLGYRIEFGIYGIKLHVASEVKND